MASNDDDFGKLLAAAVVVGGVALIAAAAAKTRKEDERANFEEAVRMRLLPKGWDLAAASLGLARDNAHVWDVTLRDPFNRLWSVRVPLAQGVAPFGSAALEAIDYAVPAEA